MQVSSRKDRKYSIVPYSESWVRDFEGVKREVETVFGELAIEIAHVGSTAIVGMSGKPTIDALVIVNDIENVDDLNEKMAKFGYRVLGGYVDPNGRLFAKEENNERLVNVHCFENGNPHAEEMIVMRDFLMQYTEEVLAYANLKMGLFSKYPDDYAAYRAVKDPYLAEMKLRAMDWKNRTLRLAAFFDRFPLLGKTILVLNQAKIPFAIGGSGCLFLLGNQRPPDDVDIYLPNDRHDEADELFGITSFPYRSEQEEVRNSNVEGDHSIQLTSKLILKVGGKQYDLALTEDTLSMRLELEHSGQKVFLYPPEDVLLIKALLQRGQNVGKHDVEDIHAFMEIYPRLRTEYLNKRIRILGAEVRVGDVFKK